MTAKRFIFRSTEIEDTLETDVDYKYISCNKDGFQDLCELLNEIHEENEQLKQNCKNYTWYKKYKQLLNENGQLKQELFETSKELLWATSDEVDRALHYEDEVEELRKEIFE